MDCNDKNGNALHATEAACGVANARNSVGYCCALRPACDSGWHVSDSRFHRCSPLVRLPGCIRQFGKCSRALGRLPGLASLFALIFARYVRPRTVCTPLRA